MGEVDSDSGVIKAEGQDQGCSSKWTQTIIKTQAPIKKVIVKTALFSAGRPWTTILISVVLCLSLAIVGFFTNFTFEGDDDKLFSPKGIYSTSHEEYVDTGSDFEPTKRDYNVIVHRKGMDVLSVQGVSYLFDILETMQESSGFEEVCPLVDEAVNKFDTTCVWSGATRFWNNNRALFESEVSTDEEVHVALSSPFYADGSPVVRDLIIGNYKTGANETVLQSAESFLLLLGLPQDEDLEETVIDYELQTIDTVFDLEKTWSDGFQIEQLAEQSFSDQFEQGFAENLPLIGATLVVVSLFTVLVFVKKSWVNSRAALGAGAVAGPVLAILGGFGILFISGVPVTSIHGVLPFIIVGIGLDDAFIVSSEFLRMDPSIPIEQRIENTIEEVGISIFVTTVTSAVAFALGCISSIPAVYWLCLYAFPAIILDFILCITFFVAVIMVDERRVQGRRRDCLCCFSVAGEAEDGDDRPSSEGTEQLYVDRMMGALADFLAQPAIQGLVIVVFSGVFAFCAYSTTLLEQEFDVSFVLPQGSYAVEFLDSQEIYSSTGDPPVAFVFREVDQSLPEIQAQMRKFIDDMVALDEIVDPPALFWLDDFEAFIGNRGNLTFNEQVEEFLNDPIFGPLHREDIARNENGDVTASRTWARFGAVDMDVVTSQIDALENAKDVAWDQEINANVDGSDWLFFPYCPNFFFIWEFFAACPRELATTTIIGVVAVVLISIIAIPHWTAALFVAPLICILYIDLLGFMQIFGVSVNSISYITLTVSIGLMVDFLMHVLLRYYESDKPTRKEKVKDTMVTMGASIFLGGFTSFLGVLPLTLSTLEIFNVVFIVFACLITLGLAHGLILLPVLMSLVGPEESISQKQTSEETKESFLSDAKQLEDSGKDSNNESVEMNT